MVLLLFLCHKVDMKASEKSEKVELSDVPADGVKEEEILEDDLDKAEEKFTSDESENEREGRDMVNDDQAIADEGGEDVEEGEEDGEVTLESVRLGWDLFKEWQEVG